MHTLSQSGAQPEQALGRREAAHRRRHRKPGSPQSVRGARDALLTYFRLRRACVRLQRDWLWLAAAQPSAETRPARGVTPPNDPACSARWAMQALPYCMLPEMHFIC